MWQRQPRWIFFILMVFTAILVIVDLPQNYHLKFNLGKVSVDRVINPPTISLDLFGLKVEKPLITRLGLDLSGGSHVVLEANMEALKAEDRSTALESARQVIERRVNFFGIGEPVVQTAVSAKNYRIIVELPGVSDVERAMQLIGQTASLELREFTDPAQATPGAGVVPTFFNTQPVGITGQDLRRAALSFSSQTGEPQVTIEFTPEGAKKFGEVTSRLVGHRLPIFLDYFPLTAPVVQTAITDGQGVITGEFTREAAKTLALQLNAGALPVSVSMVARRSVEATLGQESVAKSIRAGLVGLGLVALFMIAQYGRLGLIANLALILYGLLSFAIIRVLGITLTLPGVAGFILSIGMAVDSNILIFERYKEERHAGKPWAIAIEQAFGKAWDSIRDANFTTIITSLILFNPGNWQWLPTAGTVRGFAATLLIGVLTSLFTGIVVSRTYIRVLYREKT